MDLMILNNEGPGAKPLCLFPLCWSRHALVTLSVLIKTCGQCQLLYNSSHWSAESGPDQVIVQVQLLSMAKDKQTSFSVHFAIVVVICAEALTSIRAQWVIDDDGCRTPRRGVGTCIPIHACQPMIDFLTKAPQPLSQATINILQGYQCGFEGSSIKVCCPNGPIVLKNPDPSQPSNSPPDVSNHRNLNLLPAECGVPPNSERIIGGNKTALFEFPWMALISYQTGNGPEFKCGGTVISNKYILTAAHCITNLSNLRLLGVRVGEHNITSTVDCETIPGATEPICAPPVQDLPIEESIPHPRYNASTYTFDIGLIRVANTINLPLDNVRPICLPAARSLLNQNFTSTRLIVTGWGATESGRRSDDLLKVEVPVIPLETCRKTYEKSTAIINHRQICAGGKNKQDSCGGDSGGPLQKIESYNADARFVQYGIVSFGPKFCGQEGFPGVYSRVEYYMDWILDNMKP